MSEPLTKENFVITLGGSKAFGYRNVVSALEGLKEDMRIHFLTQYGAEDLRYNVDKWFPFLKDEKGKVRE